MTDVNFRLSILTTRKTADFVNESQRMYDFTYYIQQQVLQLHGGGDLACLSQACIQILLRHFQTHVMGVQRSQINCKKVM